MYAKLALRNARKSIKDYLIYFITLSLCVSLFYAFMSLTSSDYEFITEKSYNFEMLKFIMKYATYVISALLVLLIGYVNQYMMKRRQREFATYILLGTEQKSVAFMFFCETLIMGILSIFMGILIGILFSQVVTALVLVSAKQDITVKFRFYKDTVAITFLFFLAMFCIIGLYNVKVLRKRKLIQMLNAEKKSEFQFKRSGKVYGAALLLAIICLVICGYNSFHLIQVVKKGTKTIMEQNVSAFVALVTFLIGIYAFFYCIAYIMVVIKEKWISFKYEGTNLFLIGTIASKIKTAPLFLATICITFLGAAVSFLLTMIMAQWSIGYLDCRAPFDLNFSNYYSVPGTYSIKNLEEIPKLDYEKIVSQLEESQNQLKSYCQVEKYFLHPEDIGVGDPWNMPVVAISLSDFNKLRDMLGYEPAKLKENEFAIQWKSTAAKDIKDSFLEEHKTIQAGTQTYTMSQTPSYSESLGDGIYNYWCDEVYILSDAACSGLSLASTDFYAFTEKEMSWEDSVDFEEDYMVPWLFDNYEDALERYNITEENYYQFINLNVKVKEVNTILNASLAMRILGIYLGVVLMMISLTVLALQQLADSIEHKARYGILKKLGVEKKEINKIILKQISVYFILPVFIALIGVVVFVCNYYSIYEAQISSYIGGAVFAANISIAVALIILVYICYFTATYYTFKRNVQS